ncbi:MAG: hypothetical protein KF752_10245 [Pirellulaceae bacterium]|nr:hypothetical protein [Pirellulaceae bacterium]
MSQLVHCQPATVGLPFRLATIVLTLGVVLSSGCQFSPKFQADSLWPWKKQEKPQVPDRILAVWSDSVLHQPGQPGVRGFGGRIYFYKTDINQPVTVDGGLAVYVFDADQVDPLDQKPLRKFVYTAEQFTQHMSRTELGPSYSVWLPWDEVGGASRKLSLIARYEGSQGGTTISEPAIKLLPGVPASSTKDQPTELADSQSNVRVVGHQRESREPVIQGPIPGARPVHTIDLPPAFHQHLKSESTNLGTPPNNPNLAPGVVPPIALNSPHSPQLHTTASQTAENSAPDNPQAENQQKPVNSLADRQANLRQARPLTQSR